MRKSFVCIQKNANVIKFVIQDLLVVYHDITEDNFWQHDSNVALALIFSELGGEFTFRLMHIHNLYLSRFYL